MHRISRRSLLHAALATVTSTTAAALLAACGETAAPTPISGIVATVAPTTAPTVAPAAPTMSVPGATTAPAPTTAAAAMTTGGTMPTATPAIALTGKTIPELRVAVAALTQTMDPTETQGNVDQRIHYSCFDTLIRRDFLDGNKLVPSLATEWKRVDEKTFEVTLRQGVLWQDGTPFTAADVKYTFDRIIGKDPKLGAASPVYFPLAKVDILDDFHVRFTSSDPDLLLDRRLAGLGAGIIPAKYHAAVGTNAFRTKPIGTGPYKLVEFVVDDHITFEAHDKYFGGAPAAKRVTFRAIPEVPTRIAALISGEVDLITNLPPDQLPTIMGNKNLAVRQTTLANAHVLNFNFKVKPADRREIRQALSIAIDRKALAEQLWNGNAVYTRSFQYEGENLYDATRPPIPYDPNRAKMLLAQGGYAGETIVYQHNTPNYYTNEHEAAESIVSMWKMAGINARIETVELAQGGKLFMDNTRHLTTTSVTSGIADPDGFFWRSFGPDTALQKNGYWPAESAATFNRLGKQARTLPDGPERATSYRQMLDEFEREVPGMHLYTPKEAYGIRNTLQWTPYSLYYMDLRPYNFQVK